MAGVTWPSTLPQSFDKSSFESSLKIAVVTTQNSTGPSKIRGRYTSNKYTWVGTITMTETELDRFEFFFENEISSGLSVFNMSNPLNLSDTVEVRLDPESATSPMYSIAPLSGSVSQWLVSFRMEAEEG